MMIIWCVVALAGLGGLYFVIRARAIRGRRHPGVSSEVSAELIRRADQQNRWALRGEARGVYGARGAELMRSVSPEPNVDTELEKATAYPQTAVIASTPEDLATLLAERLPCWRWAAFVSVLVQRRAELESRLHDNQLGYGAPSGERARELLQKAVKQFDPSDPTSPMAKHTAELSERQQELTELIGKNHDHLAKKVAP
jgi:hypothetical protein